jgi:hypothetical protein
MQQLSQLDAIKKEYQEKRSVFIPGDTMKDILLTLGAQPEDFTKLTQISNNLADDPTQPFRKSRNGRFCFNFDNDRIERLEFQPFVLSVEEDFIRHDSGQIRHFRGINDDLQLNTVFQAIMRFKAYIIDGVSVAPRARLNQDINKFVCTVFNRFISSFELIHRSVTQAFLGKISYPACRNFYGCPFAHRACP